MTVIAPPTVSLTGPPANRFDVLRSIEQRILWLSTAIIDHANHVRPNPSGLKVGGHQASSASMVSLMTALWFEHLRPEDRVSVKPHASPVLHAIKYLLGELDESYLTRLREFGGLQSYPSRAKDPDSPDYSTGSVGIGATAPIWAALARRYVNQHFDAGGHGRQYSLVGDAELDEGACWEAIIDPLVAELGEVVWIVDLNRQSLDRVVPNIAAHRLEGMFAAAGWQVITVKYGRPARAAVRPARRRRAAPAHRRHAQPGVPAAAALRRRRAAPSGCPATGPMPSLIRALVADVERRRPARGDPQPRRPRPATRSTRRSRSIDDTRPTVIFAYTVKGYGLATEGHPQNHSALLTRRAARRSRADARRRAWTSRWRRSRPARPQPERCAAGRGAPGRRDPVRGRAGVRGPDRSRPHPDRAGHHPGGTGTGPARPDPGRAGGGARGSSPSARTSVSSTNLAGWVNKVGVWSHDERPDWFADDAETILHWRERPTGQHIELGIAEVNLVGADRRARGDLEPVGRAADPDRRALRPVRRAGPGAVVVRHLRRRPVDPGRHAVRRDAGPRGWRAPVDQDAVHRAGAARVHRPTNRRSPSTTEWTLLAAMGQLGRPGGRSAYLRLSTRPVDQSLADSARRPAARERRRRQVVAGGYVLRRAEQPAVTICAMGAMVPEAVEAAQRLSELGFAADVVVVTSPGPAVRGDAGAAGLRGRAGVDPRHDPSRRTARPRW